MSRPAQDCAIVDAGFKPLASAFRLAAGLRLARRASDEHGRLDISAAINRLYIGDQTHLIPGHCDPTVNPYDWYVCIRDNCVE